MGTLIMVLQLIGGLSILVIVHEFGHFIAARAFGMRVEKFYLFFDAYGKKLFSFKKGDTEYGIGWLPLGGYVKIAGMVDESMDKDQIAQPAQPWEFRSKPAWQRLIVMLGGVFFNVILGYIIFVGKVSFFGETVPLNSYANNHGGIYVGEVGKKIGFNTGDKIVSVNGKEVVYFSTVVKEIITKDESQVKIIRDNKEIEFTTPKNVMAILTNGNQKKGGLIELGTPFSIDTILPKSPAEKANMRKGDRVIAINDEPIKFWQQFASVIAKNNSKDITLKVQRGQDTLLLNAAITPQGTIGVGPKIDDIDQFKTTIKHNIAESVSVGIRDGNEAISIQMQAIIKLITGKLNFLKSVSSPIGIAKAYGAELIWENFWYFTGMISFVLAIMNLLPIPALDGGHVIFLTIEMIRGKPFSDKVMMNAQMIGFYILMSLMVVAFASDLFFK